MGDLKRKCSHCGSDNSYSDKFCLKCGRKLPKSPINYYGDFSQKNSNFYDDLKNKTNKDQSNKIKDKPKIKTEKPEGFRNWWKSKDFITKGLIILGGIILFFILIGVIGSQLSDTTTNETTNNSTVVTEESVINDTQADIQQQQKEDKIDEIENSKALKDGVEQLARIAYTYDQPNVKNIKIDELKSNNEVIVSFDVDWIDVYGDTKTDHQTDAIFIKKGGKWVYQD